MWKCCCGLWQNGLKLPAELETALRPAAWRSATGWLTIIAGGIFGPAAGKDGVWTQFCATGDNLQGARQLGVRNGSHSHCGIFVERLHGGTGGIVFASQIGFIPTRPVPGWR